MNMQQTLNWTCQNRNSDADELRYGLQIGS